MGEPQRLPTVLPRALPWLVMLDQAAKFVGLLLETDPTRSACPI